VKKILRHWAPSIVIAVLLALVVRTYVAEAMKVPSGSMIPTIQINDHLLVEKMMWMTKLHHNDIVVFYPPVPEDKDKRYVKRLIGLPGDVIQIKDGELIRNGKKVEEPYINAKMNYTFGPLTVPADNYFFLGDNRNVSYDAHLWPTPFVEQDKLIGKVILEIPTHYIEGSK
jgi:signal peptidase I